MENYNATSLFPHQYVTNADRSSRTKNTILAVLKGVFLINNAQVSVQQKNLNIMYIYAPNKLILNFQK